MGVVRETASYRRNRVIAALGLVACAFVVVGAFLPWQVLDIEQQASKEFRGWDLTRDAKMLVALGVAGSALLGLVASVRETLALLMVRTGLVMVGAVVAGLAALDIRDMQRDVGIPGVTSSVGIGLPLIAVGAALLVVLGGAVQWRPARN